jgi:hypothetical protein
MSAAPREVVPLLRRYFLNRTDAVAFAPSWPGDVARAVPGGNLGQLLSAHVTGESVRIPWATHGGKGGTTEPIRARVGTYSPAPDGTTAYGCADFDGGGRHAHPLADPLSAALGFLENCRRAGLAAHLERSGSGRGWHVWLFFDAPAQAGLVRRVLFALLPRATLADGADADARTNAGVEVFPKQDRIPPGGFGNMVWLPFWHGAAGGGNQFYGVTGGGEVEAYQLTDFETNDPDALNAAAARLAPKAAADGRPSPTPADSGRVPVEVLIEKYLKLPLGGRNDTGFDLACQLRDNGYPVSEAEAALLDYQRRVPQNGHAYTVAEAVASVRSAYTRPQREPWSRRGDSPAPRQRSRTTTDDGTVEGPGDALPPGKTGCEIIREFFLRRYRPQFRDGTMIRAGDGRDVPMGEACAVADSALIAALENATDAPRFKGGAVNRNALPTFYRTWAKVAWGDLLNGLPDEDEAGLDAVGSAREEFRRLVRDALLAEVTLSQMTRAGPSAVESRTERNSLIGWCARFAKPGPWRSIRGKLCWCRLVEHEGGELELRVAIRQGLFAQMRADRRLVAMGENKFTRRAKRYGVGQSSRDDRPHGRSAVVLARDFVEDLTASFPADDGGQPGATDGADETV